MYHHGLAGLSDFLHQASQFTAGKSDRHGIPMGNFRRIFNYRSLPIPAKRKTTPQNSQRAKGFHLCRSKAQLGSFTLHSVADCRQKILSAAVENIPVMANRTTQVHFSKARGQHPFLIPLIGKTILHPPSQTKRCLVKALLEVPYLIGGDGERSVLGKARQVQAPPLDAAFNSLS